jgi:hypothetical protein
MLCPGPVIETAVTFRQAPFGEPNQPGRRLSRISRCPRTTSPGLLKPSEHLTDNQLCCSVNVVFPRQCSH